MEVPRLDSARRSREWAARANGPQSIAEHGCAWKEAKAPEGRSDSRGWLGGARGRPLVAAAFPLRGYTSILAERGDLPSTAMRHGVLEV